MIRNVVMGRLRTARDDADETAMRAQLKVGLDGILNLQLPGLLANTIGPDAGLRAGGWDFAIVNDWADAAAYQNYDLDLEHNTYRAQVAGLCEQVARVQFEV